MRRCEGLPRFARRIGERYACNEVLAGAKLATLDLRSRSTVLWTAYRAIFFDIFSGSPKTRTGRQFELSSSSTPPPKAPRPQSGCEEGSSVASIFTQSPEKHPTLTRVLVSTNTRASSSSSLPGFGCTSSSEMLCRSPCALNTLLLVDVGPRAVVAVKLEYTDPGVAMPFVRKLPGRGVADENEESTPDD